jgi:metallophosphoesterase (TIGR00282 family)
MPIRLAILGDIVGTPGRQAVTQQLPVIRQRFNTDLILANAENAANGSGLTPEQYRKLIDAGLDGITLGDHCFKKAQIAGTLEREPNIIRPANLSAKAKGRGMMRLELQQDGRTIPIYVMTVMGRLFMGLPSSDPFACVDRLLASIPEPNAIKLVEVHAEASSEKIALGWYLSGRVSCVFGTHTHIPTADARLLPAHVLGSGGEAGPPALPTTAYITDLGMSGPRDSVLGRKVEKVLHQMTTSMPAPFDVAEGAPTVQGIVVEIDASHGRARSIERFDLPADVTAPPFAVR